MPEMRKTMVRLSAALAVLLVVGASVRADSIP
jgi:hypothetical protein